MTGNERLTAEERRRRIFDAGVQAFAEKGYRATSVREICTAAGITQPVFYDHFPSKRTLFEAILATARDELVETGSRAMAREAPPRERFTEAVDEFFRFVEEKPALARVLLTGSEGEPDLAALDRSIQAEATERLTAILQATIRREGGRTRGEDQATLRVEFIKLGIHGLAEWWWDNPNVPREAIVAAAVDVCWFGIRESFEPRT